MWDEVRAENAQLKVVLDLSLNVPHRTDIFACQASITERDEEISRLQMRLGESDLRLSTMQQDIGSRDSSIADLNLQLSQSKAETAAALSEFGVLQETFGREKSALELRVAQSEGGLRELERKADLHSSVLARLTDPVTGVPHRCPLIQTNGVVQSFDTMIRAWIKEPDIGQSHACRMFTCPVSKSLTMISPFLILDGFIKLAGSAGIDTSSPITFLYKKDDAWIEFSFHEQLELIARLCSVYRDRQIGDRLPEQRGVSIPGCGAVLILLRAIALGGDRFRLECCCIHNDGSGGRVEIKTVMDPDWENPFSGMEFPCA
jgi:hypothetical protein